MGGLTVFNPLALPSIYERKEAATFKRDAIVAHGRGGGRDWLGF